LLALRQGKRELALRYFDISSDLGDQRFPTPIEVDEEEVRDILDRQVSELPPDLQKGLANVPIIMEERPDEALLMSADPPLDPLLLGLFEGMPITETSSFDVITAPTRIVLFLENIWLV